MGILGLCFLLFLSQNNLELCGKLFIMSKEESKKFDFSIILLHLSMIVIKQIKNGKMNNYLNSQSSIQSSMFQLFVGLCEEFYEIWKKNNFKDNDFHILESKMTLLSEKKWKKFVEIKKKIE
jgi:hypothetical protein